MLAVTQTVKANQLRVNMTVKCQLFFLICVANYCNFIYSVTLLFVRLQCALDNCITGRSVVIRVFSFHGSVNTCVSTDLSDVH